MTDRLPRPRWPELPTPSRRRIAQDVDDELADWITARADEWRARGLKDAEALARARAEFGDLDSTRRYCIELDVHSNHERRMSRYLEELQQDVHGAWRSLRRAPLLSAVLLLTMALGIGATGALYSAFHAILLRPLPYRDADALVQLHSTEEGARSPMGQVSARMYLRLREPGRVLAGVAVVAGSDVALTQDGTPERVRGARVSANLLSVLGTQPALGNWFSPADDSAGAEPVVVLSAALWRRRYGADSGVVGRSIDLNGSRRRVVGVMRADFLPPLENRAQLFVPLDLSATLADEERSHKFRFLQIVARTAPGTAIPTVQAELDGVMAGLSRERPDAYTGMGLVPVPLRDEMTGGIRAPLLALVGAAVLLLLITCANVTSVWLARAVTRRGEFAVRVALGAGRGRMTRQLLTESLVLSLLGGAAGLALALIGIKLLHIVGGTAIPAGFTLEASGPAVLVAFAASLLCGLGFGTVPALVAGRLGTHGVSMGGARGTEGPRRLRLRRGLVAAQVALSLALLVGTGLLARTLRHLMELDLGYRTEQLATFSLSLPDRRYNTAEEQDAFFAALFERIAAVPGVESVGMTTALPMLGSAGASLVIEGRPFEGDRPPEVRYGSVSDEYFRVMGIPIVSGRGFAPGDESQAVRAVVVSASTARKFWHGADPVGAHVRLGPDPREPWSTVVGVVGDVVLGASGDLEPAVFSSMRYDRWGGGDVVVSYRGATPPLAELRSAVTAIDPLLPVEGLRTVDAVHRDVLSDRRLPLQLVSAFAVLAVMLVALGLYGVGSNQVESRRRELGVRMALGAPRTGILRMVLGDGLRTVATGVVIGIPLSLLLMGRIQALLYQVRPFDPLVLAAVVALLVTVGVLAVLVPARRATQVDPAAVLRGE
jgi:putative ABC transport system permease protein